MDNTLEKFSSQLDRDVLAELREYARESNQRISSVLTEAVSSHLQRVRVRPAFRRAMDEILEENSELLSRLAK
jgi:glutamate-1-semialdehyde aminotransferase